MFVEETKLWIDFSLNSAIKPTTTRHSTVFLRIFYASNESKMSKRPGWIMEEFPIWDWWALVKKAQKVRERS